MRKTYYFETVKPFYGPFEYKSDLGDAHVINLLKEHYKNNLLCVYIEDENSADGTPFIMLYEKGKS